ncbi:sulfite oxidase heme-binding subunit YedZ [Azospirillum sp. ST 5-10]|uniref:sulfite oxidase heme-binding subunit YedZ n=1 Tax=unclassified Azospirillum TaxID=2630922 RepID=UPI003F49F4FD
MMGLFAFFYALLHLLTYVGIDQFFDWRAVWTDIVQCPYITVGMVAFLILSALAATSAKAAVRRLGGRHWRALHKAVFLAGVAGCLHYILLVKGWQSPPFLYTAAFAFLLGLRFVRKAEPAGNNRAFHRSFSRHSTPFHKEKAS